MTAKKSVVRTAQSALTADTKARDKAAKESTTKTVDSFVNFSANIGVGTDNIMSGGTYGFNPITRNRTLLEWIHRGSWIGGLAVNIIADDMLRAKREGRPHMLELAHEAGMRQAGYGIESGSPTILKSIDKSGQTVEKMEMAIRETQRVLGYADCSFMIGSPGETRQTVQETVDFCRRVNLKPEVMFFTTAYPATTFWKLALDKGLIAKSVTGKKGPANDDIIEQYFLRLGEQGESVRTNFSDLPDEEIVELSWWAINELGAQNVVRHPHTGEEAQRVKPVVRDADKADV